MARVFDGLSGGEQGKQDHRQTFFADDQDRVEVPSSGFTADAHIARDGQDLLLTSPEGQTIEIKGYFSADAAPVVQAPDGSVLTPGLVSSFVQSAPEYAANDTASDASPIGAAQEVKGEAFVIHTDGSKEKIAIGTPIFEGDVIETSKEGAVNIGFIDDTSLAVSENARVALDHYTYDASTESGKQDISVLRGVFVFTSGLIGRDDPDDVHINTPVGSIGIRGTIIAGHINPGGESEISVLEGAIVVKNDTSEVVLTQQYEAVKILGHDAPIENRGVLEAHDIAERFGAVSDVIPALFSTVNDSAKEQNFTVQPGAQTPADATAPNGDAPQNEEDVIPEEALPQDGQPESPVLDPVAPPQDVLPMDSSFMNGPMLGDRPVFDLRPPMGMEPLDPLTGGPQPLPGTMNPPPGDFKPIGPNPLNNITPINPPPSVLNNTDTNTGGDSSGSNATTSGLILNTGTSAQGVSTISDNIGNKIGYSVSGAGDVNNDGFDDFIFSNNTNTVGQNNTYVVYGAATTGVPTGLVSGLKDTLIVFFNDPDVNPGDMGIFTNPAATNFQQTTIAGIGDFDGDNIEDYLIGQPNVDGTGKAFIVNGANPANYITLSGFATGDQGGFSVTGIGDINNDGKNDIVIGAPGVDASGTDTGKAYLIFGSSIGGGNVNVGSLSPSVGQSFAGSPGDRLGHSVLGIGDFDGDGRMDFATGAPSDTVAGTDSGNIIIWRKNGGSYTILDNDPGTYAGEQMGRNMAATGDFNGDGRSDFLAASEAPDTNGNYNIHLITHDGTTRNDQVVLRTSYELRGGGGVGDWNGDGFDDFAVAMDDNKGNAEIYVVFGGGGAIPSYTWDDLQKLGNAFKMTYQGYTGDVEISSVGDVNGDGFDDMGIGLSTADGGNGQVLVVNGRGVAQAPNSVVGNDGNNAWVDSTPLQNESYVGGKGDDSFTFTNLSFRNIDGGTGEDALYLNGAINLSPLDFERVSQIEQLRVGTASTLTLTAENIFNLLQTSDTGNLHIGGTDGTSVLTIDGGSFFTNATGTQVASELNAFSGGIATGSTNSGIMRIDLDGTGFGPSLYIDTNTLTVNIVP